MKEEAKVMEIEIEERTSRNKAEIKTQEKRGTIQALDIPQVCFVIIAK